MVVLGLVLLGLLGLAIGSFLNVVIWRVPRGESVVQPAVALPDLRRADRAAGQHSGGLLAGAASSLPPLQRRDLGPVSAWWSWRRPGCSSLFAVRFGAHADLPAYLYLAAVGIALAMIDLDLQRLPDVLTLPSYPVGLALLGIAAGVEGAGWPFVRALIGMGALFGFYAIVWFVYPAGMGLGDVKLSGVLGLYLGWLGWGSSSWGRLPLSCVGAVVSIAVIAVKGGNRKTKVPFGPFMLVGVLIATFAGHRSRTPIPTR